MSVDLVIISPFFSLWNWGTKVFFEVMSLENGTRSTLPTIFYFQIEDLSHHSRVVFLAWFLSKKLLRIKRYHLIFLSTSVTDSHGHALNIIITSNCIISGILISSLLFPGKRGLFRSVFIPRFSLLQFFNLIESPNPMPLLLLNIHQLVTSSFYFCRFLNWFHDLSLYPSLTDTLNSFASLFCHCFCWTKPQPWVKTTIHLLSSCTVAAKLYWRKSQSLTYWFYIK